MLYSEGKTCCSIRVNTSEILIVSILKLSDWTAYMPDANNACKASRPTHGHTCQGTGPRTVLKI